MFQHQLNLDNPLVTINRQKILTRKKFLRKVYETWYIEILNSLPNEKKKILELGAGSGFLKDFIPGLVTSDVLTLKDIDVVLDGCRLPFKSGCLDAIVFTNVLHHIAQPEAFFSEAGRCVRPGGAIVMIEPWNTHWARLIYSNLHHEKFDPNQMDWTFESTGPLSGANIAIPWIIFSRDSVRFIEKFPGWKIFEIKLMMPLTYLISGGFSTQVDPPASIFRLMRLFEESIQKYLRYCAMFAKITLYRV